MRMSILAGHILILMGILSMPALAEDSIKTAGIAMQNIEACRVEYTEIGRRLSFSGSVTYQAVVGNDGVIADLNQVRGKEVISKAVRLDQFESCMKRWRFQDPGEYSIAFHVGTTLEHWEIIVTAKNGSLKVVL